MRLERGDTVDRYTVEKLLGAGGTAVVYLVKHRSLGTLHALKMLTIHGESIKRRLLQEGKAQATLGHLNVVAVTDIVEIQGSPGLLMEYITGPSLEDALLEYRLTMADAETLFLGVLAGVRAAHQQGIIHRDLKPANVLLDPTEAGFVPKVADFGLAKAVRGKDKRKGSTRQGVAMGTPSYMAPEQIRDAGKVDERADIFSLGCILYEIVTRRRAFPGEETLDIYNNVSKGAYVPARRLVPDLPDRIDNAIRGCIQVDKEHRIPDCDTLQAVLRGETTWDHGLDPDTMPEPPPLPSIASHVPPLTLAPRGEDGETPVPMSRVATAPTFGIESPTSETAEIEAATLMPPQPEPDNGFGKVAAALLVLGSLLVLLVALLIAAIGVGLPLILDLPEPTVDVRPAQPAPTPVPIAPDPSKVEPAPEAPDPIEAPEDPQPTESPDPVEPVEPVVAPAPVAVPRPVPPRPETPVLADVKILSDPPSAAIHVDGEPSGRATNAKLQLPVGRHEIRLESGGRTANFSVVVNPSGTARWCYVFETGQAVQGSCPR